MTAGDQVQAHRRRLSYVGFAAIVIGYLAVIKGSGFVVSRIWEVHTTYSTRDVILGMWLPLGAALVYTYAWVAWLGWRRPVMHDDHPTQRWVWAVPTIFLVCIALAINYSALSKTTVGYVLALLVATQIVGWGEEGMFRGIGVVTLRDYQLSEGKVALWSSVVFGAVHISNALTGNLTQALPQAIVVSFAGYFFYLIRRVSRGNVLNSVIHGLFDFSVISGTGVLANQHGYVGSGAAILAYVVVGILLIVRRHHIEPASVRRA